MFAAVVSLYDGNVAVKIIEFFNKLFCMVRFNPLLAVLNEIHFLVLALNGNNEANILYEPTRDIISNSFNKVVCLQQEKQREQI